LKQLYAACRGPNGIFLGLEH